MLSSLTFYTIIVEENDFGLILINERFLKLGVILIISKTF